LDWARRSSYHPYSMMTRLALGLVLVLSVAACKDKAAPGVKAGGSEDLARVEALRKEEGEALSRRDELKREREKVAADRAALAEKRKQVVASGGDVGPVDEEEKALAAREASLVQQEGQLNQKYDVLIRQYEEIAAGAGAGTDMTKREAALAVREKDLARREETLARREGELSARERDQAKREKETCGVGGTTTIVQMPGLPAKGSKYTKKDVEPVVQKARKVMSDKGILASDLPSPTQGLEREASQAIGEGDYGRAKFAADQLLATVESMKVDKAFVANKIGRLNGLIKGKQLDEGQQKEVDDLFRAATLDYGDGKFAAANAKLNRIYAVVR
jgi:hypothetical protein